VLGIKNTAARRFKKPIKPTKKQSKVLQNLQKIALGMTKYDQPFLKS
jgi:hypothetical protein